MLCSNCAALCWEQSAAKDKTISQGSTPEQEFHSMHSTLFDNGLAQSLQSTVDRLSDRVCAQILNTKQQWTPLKGDERRARYLRFNTTDGELSEEWSQWVNGVMKGTDDHQNCLIVCYLLVTPLMASTRLSSTLSGASPALSGPLLGKQQFNDKQFYLFNKFNVKFVIYFLLSMLSIERCLAPLLFANVLYEKYSDFMIIWLWLRFGS